VSVHRIGPNSHAPARIWRPITCRASAESATLELVAEQDAQGTTWITIQRWRLGAEAPELLLKLRPSEGGELADGLQRVLHGMRGRP
jgi:hypothetical protein